MNLDYGGLSPDYVDAIRGFEGWNPNAYGDYKQYSIGYGSKAQHPGETIDKAEGERRLNTDLSQAAGYVNGLGVNIPDGARAALTSLTQNSGPGWMNSGLGAAVKAGDWDAAKQRFAQYVNAGGQPNPGLQKRRQTELSWWDGNNDAPLTSAFADTRKSNMNPLQDAMAAQQPDNQYAYSPGYDPNAGLFARLKAAGPGALFGAPNGIFPGANGQPGYNIGNRLQQAGAFLMGKPEVAAALGGDNKFVQIGTDEVGNPRYGFVNPKTRSVTPIAGTGAAGTASDGSSGWMEAIKEGKTGEDLLNDPRVPAAYRVGAQQVIDGTVPYNLVAMRNNPLSKGIALIASAAAPGEDLTGRAAGVKQWAGKSSEIARRAGQAARHGGELPDSFSDIKGSTSFPAANAVINAFDQQTGGGAVTKAQQNITAYANEMGAFIRGNGGSDAAFKEWAQNFPINGSDEQKRAAVGMGAKLFSDSMAELENKRIRDMGAATAARHGSLFSPEAQASLKKMQEYAAGGTNKSAPTISNIRQIQ